MTRRRAQRGLSSGLLLAMIALAGTLLAAAARFTTTAYVDLAQESAAARVQRAAQAGLAWGRFRIVRTATPSCAASTALSVPWSSGAVAVTVRCTEQLPAFNEAGTPVRVFQLTAVACHPAPSGSCPDPAGGATYVQRQVSGLAQR